MRRCHAVSLTSVKEGWCLVVTEAASQGTPAVAYDVPGLRDSIKHQESGIITDPNPHALASGIVSLFKNQKRYKHMRQAGWEWSKQITFDQSYQDLKGALGIV
jgi:glycosyltransferase involved in cell wall biosynthesis